METAPLFFIHITDTHLNAPENETFLNIDTTANLREILAHVRGLTVKPAFVVITGDLAHEGVAQDYRAIRELIAAESDSLGAPILVALGNHDHRQPFNEGYLDQPDSSTAYFYARSFDSMRLLVLDSNWPGHDAGLVDEAQLAWLTAQLDAEDTPTLLAVHHPPHTNSFFPDTSHLLTNADALGEAIAGRNVLGILSGHIHFNSIAAFRGVLSAAGQGAAFGLDSTDRTGMRLINSYGYNLCMVHEGVLSVQPFSMATDRRQLLFMSFEEIMRYMEAQRARQSEAAP